MIDNGLHVELDFDDETCTYCMIFKLDDRKMTINFDIDQFESLSGSMIRLIKDVNLIQAKKYLNKVDAIDQASLEATDI